MKNSVRRKLSLAVLVAGAFAFGPAFADKPEWAGHGKPEKNAEESRRGNSHDGNSHREDHHDGPSDHDRRDARDHYFSDHHRVAVREYYEESFRSGRCPPGLAKKRNGCLPPGQARKWHKGQPLPRGVVFYNLPPSVVVRLGPPPAGHKYVRVASDLLLIAVGTRIVVDAIQDIGR